jgi:hypothetical protein
MLQLAVDNGLIKRTRRRKPELSVIEGDKKLIEVTEALQNLQNAFGHMVDANEDAQIIAKQLLAMYAEAGGKFDRLRKEST